MQLFVDCGVLIHRHPILIVLVCVVLTSLITFRTFYYTQTVWKKVWSKLLVFFLTLYSVISAITQLYFDFVALNTILINDDLSSFSRYQCDTLVISYSPNLKNLVIVILMGISLLLAI